MSSYIYTTNKNLIGRTRVKFRIENILFNKGDIIYIANKDKQIQSRWECIAKNDKIILIAKKPERTITVDYSQIINEKNENKIFKLDDKYSDIIEKYFAHNLLVFPSYDIKFETTEMNELFNKLREKDFKCEVYANVKAGNNDYNFIIIKNYGVVSFKTIDVDIFNTPDSFNDFIKELNTVDPIKNLLLKSSLLSKDGNNLNLKYKRYYIFESKSNNDYYLKANEKIRNLGYIEQELTNLKMFNDTLEQILKATEEDIIKENEHFGILQMLMPQYINSKTTNLMCEKLNFIPDQSYELDSNQKDILSQMNERCFLKAAAGSGKTILLLAKAYEVAVANPDKKFLILCYNAKLSEDIKIQAINTGKIVSNLKIYTLDKFIQDEVTNYQVYSEGKNVFEERRKIFVTRVATGLFHQKYGGIFIDEMQQLILNEECVSALIECLDDEKYMVLAGDYYQQIRSDIKEDIDDEIIDDNENEQFHIGDYEFKKIILERNYRNTAEITKVSNKMLLNIFNLMKEINLPFIDEEKDIVIGKAIKRGNDIPKYLYVKTEEEEIFKVMEILNDLIENKKYNQNEILLVAPKGYNGKYKHKLIYKLEQEIIKKGLKVCDFNDTSLDTKGIRVGTIGKAIGLDFKAVIIFGTKMFEKTKNEKYKITTIEELKNQKNSIKKDVIKYLKDIYVACSRARETLIVIDDYKQNNLITDFLRLVGEKND